MLVDDCSEFKFLSRRIVLNSYMLVLMQEFFNALVIFTSTNFFVSAAELLLLLNIDIKQLALSMQRIWQ